MRRRYGALTVLVALACNEVLGLDAGRLEGEGGGGGSFSVSGGEGGSMPVAGSDSGGGTSGASAGNVGNGGASSNAGADGMGGEAGAAPCSTNVDCIEQALEWPPYLCLAGACVDVLTEECDTVLGAEWLEDHPQDEPIVFGAVAENIDEQVASYWSLKLAMKEFAEHGAIPIDGALQRSLLLLCRVPSSDPFSTPTRRSLDHLLDHVEVPGMVLIQSRGELVASMQYAIGQKEANALFIDVDSATTEVSAIRDEGRLWHMLGDSYGISVLFDPLVRLVEEHVNPRASTGNRARLTRVVLIPPVEEDGFESSMARVVEASVHTNGRLMVDDSETYRMVIATDRHHSAARETASFAPDIVIDFAGIYDLIETYRPASGAPPFFILPPSQARSPTLRELVADDPSLQKRIVGVNYASPDEDHKRLHDAYLERLAAIAPPGVDGSASANVYEAVYFLTYAAVGGGTGRTNMNRGMTRLLGLLTNERRDIGPTTIESVIDLLGTAPSLTLHGALGPPSFDANTGHRHMAGSVWCIDENLEYAMDVLSLNYESDGRSLVGTFPCFDLGEPE